MMRGSLSFRFFFFLRSTLSFCRVGGVLCAHFKNFITQHILYWKSVTIKLISDTRWTSLPTLLHHPPQELIVFWRTFAFFIWHWHWLNDFDIFFFLPFFSHHKALLSLKNFLNATTTTMLVIRKITTYHQHTPPTYIHAL